MSILTITERQRLTVASARRYMNKVQEKKLTDKEFTFLRNIEIDLSELDRMVTQREFREHMANGGDNAA